MAHTKRRRAGHHAHSRSSFITKIVHDTASGAVCNGFFIESVSRSERTERLDQLKARSQQAYASWLAEGKKGPAPFAPYFLVDKRRYTPVAETEAFASHLEKVARTEGRRWDRMHRDGGGGRWERWDDTLCFGKGARRAQHMICTRFLRCPEAWMDADASVLDEHLVNLRDGWL